eukprot:m.44457 g.44457  ORF g.44457 m.44457 type:complete len:716 (+) comp7171_c0_seq2:129-2276(+)
MAHSNYLLLCAMSTILHVPMIPPTPTMIPPTPTSPFYKQTVASSSSPKPSPWIRHLCHGRGRRRRETVACTLLTNVFLIIIVVGNFWFMMDLIQTNSKRIELLKEQEIDEVEQRFKKKLELERSKQVHHNDMDSMTSKKIDENAFSSNEWMIKAVSSKDEAQIYINNNLVLDSRVSGASNEEGRGLYVAVISAKSGRVVQFEKFDTYAIGPDERLVTFLRNTQRGRIVAFAVRDEASFHLGDEARHELMNLGSVRIAQLEWRDTWAMVAQIGNSLQTVDKLGHKPGLDTWGDRIEVEAVFTKSGEEVVCTWDDTVESKKRRSFCSKYDGYGNICACDDPISLAIGDSNPTVIFPSLETTPTLIVASSKRPKYLLRAILSILRAQGAQRKNLLISIDGKDDTDEAVDVCRLLDLQVIVHNPQSSKAGKISQHYKFALSKSFSLFPNAEYLIVMEEDLDASVDFYKYFATTLPVLQNDNTLYCISAWNDQGYVHSSFDSQKLYRVETMPGLGWMLSRKLFKEELEPQWPGADKLWDWDMWMRNNAIRKERECIIPDISRTFHFGASGLNVNDYFQKLYFETHNLNKDANVEVDISHMTAAKYDKYLDEYILDALVLNEAYVIEKSDSNPCGVSIPKATPPSTKFVLYMKMDHHDDFETWKHLAKCWKLWDLDVRGFHKGVWRFYLEERPMVVVGTPFSPFSHHKPKHITPLLIHKES